MNSKQRRRYVRKHLPELKIAIITARITGDLVPLGDRYVTKQLEHPE